MLGGGWDRIQSGSPFALALFIQVPYDLTNRAHEWSLELLDSDGVPRMPGPVEQQAVRVGGHLEVGATDRDRTRCLAWSPLAVSIGPLPLEPGRYEWRFRIADRRALDVTLQRASSPAGRCSRWLWMSLY